MKSIPDIKSLKTLKWYMRVIVFHSIQILHGYYLECNECCFDFESLCHTKKSIYLNKRHRKLVSLRMSTDICLGGFGIAI